ncbi:MAG TPA: peptidylprolyl isomerase [Terriglobales bacterium]
MAKSTTGTTASSTQKKAAPAVTASDPAVITIQGLCSSSERSAAASKSAPCKTTITRSEFEKMVNAVRPDMPPAQRKQFAEGYAKALVMAHDAHEKGLDRGPTFEEMMKLMRIQIASQEYAKSMHDKAAQISDKDLQDYYDKNATNYRQADLERIYIPKTKQLTSKDNANPDELKKQRDASEAEMKKEAEALHTRAVAGEDFVKLQTDAFDAAGMKVQSPSTKLTNVREGNFPPEQRVIFSLKPNDVSDVLTNQSGYFIYKLDAKNTVPLSQVKEEIRNTLSSQRFQDAMQTAQGSTQLSYDEEYFKALGPNITGGNVPSSMKPVAETHQ